MQFGIFPAFFEKPLRIRFEQQETDENIELFLRKHWFTNVGWIIVAVILSILPFVIVITDVMLNLGFTTNLPASISTGIIIIWYMLLSAYIIENFLYWYFNIYIVTNKHIVDVNYSSLLSRSVVEVKLADVQSQKASIKGIFRQLFNFGDVVIETAAENQRIDFIDIPKPDFVADRVQDLKSLVVDGGNP
jgi:membrane protein YdbS with pleckstrin-like domain